MLPLGPMTIGKVGARAYTVCAMTKRHLLLAFFIAAIASLRPASAAEVQDQLSSVASASEQAARSGDVQTSAVLAGVGFEDKGQDTGFVSPPLVPMPARIEGSQLNRPTGDLIVGDPSKASLREPRNPLTKDEKPKEQKSGYGFLWALGGALALGAVGFLLAGPIGAGIGFVLGGVLGAVFRR